MIIALVFIVGLVFGSFLNAVIFRLKNGQSLLFGRSFCPKCKILLKWYDLIPIFSFIYLRGRCRYCKEKISWQYPIVELLSGLIWILVAYKLDVQFFSLREIWQSQTILNFLYYIFILSALLVTAVYDYKWKIIPNKIVYPAIAIALVYDIFPPDKGGLWGGLLTAAAAFLFFFLIYFFSKGRAMGLGDGKLAFLIGLFLSPLSAAVAFTLAFIIGAAFGILLIGFGRIFHSYKKWGLKSRIAFGPFMAIGAVIAFLLSNFISNSIIF